MYYISTPCKSRLDRVLYFNVLYVLSRTWLLCRSMLLLVGTGLVLSWSSFYQACFSVFMRWQHLALNIILQSFQLVWVVVHED